MKNYTQSLKVIALSLMLSFGISFIYAATWIGPTALPPGGNIDAPINASSTPQYKNGSLGLGGFFSGYSGASFMGNVGIGTTAPAAALEVAGNIKSSLVGFTFPDGTTQTTANSLDDGFITGTYFGSGVDNREIPVGFSPDDVEVGTTNTYESMHRSKYMPANTSQAVSSGGFYTDSIKTFTTNGFTIGTRANVNEVGRSYWYKAFKSGTPLSSATPVINSFSISPSPIGIGQATTATWASSRASYCVASGNGWSGIKASSGTASITPGTSGVLTEYITCYNDSGQSAASSTTVDVKNWIATAGSGNAGESCDSWLSRTGQAGVNGSAPRVTGAAFGTQDGKCAYGAGVNDQSIIDGIISDYGFISFNGGGQGIPYYGALPSNTIDARIFPFHWHCCGDVGGTQVYTETRR